MIRWLTNWWQARQRRIDLQILWPVCKAKSRDLEHAKAVFSIHAYNDEAWIGLDYEEIGRIIDELV